MHHTRFKFSVVLLATAFLGAGCIRFTATANDGGVFLSKDGGATWEQKVFMRQEKKKTITIAGEEITTMLFEPASPSVLYIGTEKNGIYRTADGGETWTRFLSLRGRIAALAVHPKNTQTLFAIADGRVLRTSDGGKNWAVAYMETRPNVSLADVAIDAFDPKRVYLALSNGDLMQSRDNGNAWAVLYNAGSAIRRIAMHPKDTRVITLLTASDGLHRTQDLGTSWVSLRDSLAPYGGGLSGQALVLSPTDPQALYYFSSFGLLRTGDGGKTWNEVKLLTVTSATPVTAFSVSPQKWNELYYATAAAFYISRDGGATWTTKQLPSVKSPVALLAHPKDPKILYLAVTSQKK